MKKLDKFTEGYVICALWSTNDESTPAGGEPMDKNYDIEDIDSETLDGMIKDCKEFQEKNAKDLEKSGLTPDKQGHDFWLDRNGHGTGFWDEYSQTTCEKYNTEQAIAIISRDFSKRDNLKTTCQNCPYHVCERLADASKERGQVYLYVNEGKIYSN